jgi:hypothetical protein
VRRRSGREATRVASRCRDAARLRSAPCHLQHRGALRFHINAMDNKPAFPAQDQADNAKWKRGACSSARRPSRWSRRPAGDARGRGAFAELAPVPYPASVADQGGPLASLRMRAPSQHDDTARRRTTLVGDVEQVPGTRSLHRSESAAQQCAGADVAVVGVGSGRGRPEGRRLRLRSAPARRHVPRSILMAACPQRSTAPAVGQPCMRTGPELVWSFGGRRGKCDVTQRSGA